MISERLEGKNPNELNISADQIMILRELVEKLKVITIKIEELDNREEEIIGNTDISRDERRAIDISRAILVNEQKDIEEKISEILNSDPTRPHEEPPLNRNDFGSIESLKSEGNIDASPHNIDKIDIKESSHFYPKDLHEIRKEQLTQEFIPEEKVKKAIFKFHVRSFKVCPGCGARLPANFRICGRCGTKLQNFCPNCGAGIPERVDFCGKCGRRIT